MVRARIIFRWQSSSPAPKTASSAAQQNSNRSALVCGSTDNADGKPDVLQELALKIAALGGPAYDAAFDRNSSDLRGIAPAFLYRTDRVELVSPAGR
jgi:hypothetical protein